MEYVIGITIVGLIATNIYSMYVIFNLRLLEKSKDVYEFKKLKEPKKKVEIPDEVDIKLY